jgi:hypothetical protein
MNNIFREYVPAMSREIYDSNNFTVKYNGGAYACQDNSTKEFHKIIVPVLFSKGPYKRGSIVPSVFLQRDQSIITYKPYPGGGKYVVTDGKF